MGAEHLIKWKCDLCDRSETIPLLTKPPAGWVQISCEDNYEERCWHDKVICHYCLELIERQKPDFTPRLEKGVLNDPNNVAQSH